MDVGSNKVPNETKSNEINIPFNETLKNVNTHNKCSKELNLTVTNKRDKLCLFHQNIRGLNNSKIEELSIQWTTLLPHILCITEHHLKDSELNKLHIDHYTLGASYCRQSRTHGGVSIFVHNSISFHSINLNKICNDHDFEACAIKLLISSNNYTILCICRPPTGNYTTFLSHLELTLSQIYTNTTNLIICGDINVDYLQDTRNKSLLNSLLASYNLHSAVNFPTRISRNSSTIIDNIFIDKIQNMNYTTIPIMNGLSDHDGQFIQLHDQNIPTQETKPITRRIINKVTIAQFKINLSYESWYDVFNDENLDSSFNKFLNIFLRIYYNSFPTKIVYKHNSQKKNLVNKRH